MIPPLNETGLLPDGIHDCTLEEAAERFGGFQSSDRRPELWARFAEFVREVKACGVVDVATGSPISRHPLAGRSSRHRRSREKEFSSFPLFSLLAQSVIFSYAPLFSF